MPQPFRLRLPVITGALTLSLLGIPQARAADDAADSQERGTVLGPGTSIMVGAGATVAPAYQGANKAAVTPLPVIEVRGLLGNRVFLTTQDGLGVNLLQAGPLTAGVSVTYAPGRLSSASDKLKGLSDISGAAAMIGFVRYDIRPFSVDLKATDIFGPNPGTEVSLAAHYAFQPMDRLRVTMGPEVTWADSRYQKTYFGVSAEAAARATAEGNPLSAYSPGAGIKDVGFSINGLYQLTPHWGLLGHVGLTELVGNAAHSPLTQRDFQPSVSLGATYRF